MLMGKVVDLAGARAKRPVSGVDALRPVAERAKQRGDPAGNGTEREITSTERDYLRIRETTIESIRGLAKRKPEEKISSGRIRDAEDAMGKFGEIEKEIEREIEKFRGGTYPLERPKEYAHAMARACLAMYLIDKMKEIHARVLQMDRNSLFEVFIVAAQGAGNMLSGSYFRKSNVEIMLPVEYGYFDLRVEPPLAVCAEETGVELLPLQEAANRYIGAVWERIKRA